MVDWRNLTAGVQEKSRATFGTPALYRVDDQGAGVEIRGIFRDASIDVIVDLRADAAMLAPAFDVLVTDLPAGALDDENDTVELTDPPPHIPAGKRWRVRDDEPDGEGMTRLLLTES